MFTRRKEMDNQSWSINSAPFYSFYGDFCVICTLGHFALVVWTQNCSTFDSIASGDKQACRLSQGEPLLLPGACKRGRVERTGEGKAWMLNQTRCCQTMDFRGGQSRHMWMPQWQWLRHIHPPPLRWCTSCCLHEVKKPCPHFLLNVN